MRNLLLLPLVLLMLSCNEEPVVNAAGDTNTERAHPATYVKVNYEVRKNLVGKKIIEGDVLNAGRFQTYTSVSLSIEMTDNGKKTVTEYTVPGKLAPGSRNPFRYKPEGNPDHIAVRVSAATAE